MNNEKEEKINITKEEWGRLVETGKQFKKFNDESLINMLNRRKEEEAKERANIIAGFIGLGIIGIGIIIIITQIS